MVHSLTGLALGAGLARSLASSLLASSLLGGSLGASGGSWSGVTARSGGTGTGRLLELLKVLAIVARIVSISCARVGESSCIPDRLSGVALAHHGGDKIPFRGAWSCEMDDSQQELLVRGVGPVGSLGHGGSVEAGFV